MLEIAFNELSLPPVAKSKDEAIRTLNALFGTLDAITNLKIAPVRLRSSKDLALVNYCEDFLSIKDWLKLQGMEDRQRYLGYIGQDELVADNPYFKLEDRYVIGLGYAAEQELLAISLNLNAEWKEDHYSLTREFLVIEPKEDILTDTANAHHCPTIENAPERKPWLIETYLTRQSAAAAHVDSLQQFWDKREILFPWLTFCDGVKSMIDDYGSVNSQEFKKAKAYLIRLNEHLQNAKLGRSDFDKLPGDCSPEGEATLNAYSDERTFTLPNGNSKVFSLHVKLGSNLRIHLYPDHAAGKYYVGYIGLHLPTTNFSK